MALAPPLVTKMWLLTHTAEPPNVNIVSGMNNKYDFNMITDHEFRPNVLVNKHWKGNTFHGYCMQIWEEEEVVWYCDTFRYPSGAIFSLQNKFLVHIL
jgi:hypothetical protein